MTIPPGAFAGRWKFPTHKETCFHSENRKKRDLARTKSAPFAITSAKSRPISRCRFRRDFAVEQGDQVSDVENRR